MSRLGPALRLLHRHIVNAGHSPGGLTRLAARLVRLASTGEWRAIVARHAAVAELYGDYPRWFQAGTDGDAAATAAIAAALAAAPARPLISILMPTRNADARWLTAAIESVRAQAYDNWQLCIVDDGSTTTEGPVCATDFASRDARVEFRQLPEHAGIAAATTAALAMARGTLVTFLDHDDALTPDALLVVARAFIEEPRLRFVYSDEDKIDLAGSLYWPVFKPAWNPDLLLANNYITHLVAVDVELAREVGIRSGFDGAQDWDFVLRATERLDAEEIGHIPRVIYHWRAARGSTAAHAEAKDYVVAAQRRVLEDAVQRRGLNAHVDKHAHCWRVRRALVEAPLASIVIPLRNRASLLRDCLSAIGSHSGYRNYEIVLVDNDSDEADALALLARLETTPGHRVIRVRGPFNFARLANRGVAAADGSIVVLLNNDTAPLQDEWLTELVVHAQRPEVGAVGASLLYPDGTIQHIGTVLGLNGASDHIYRGMPGDWSGVNGRAQSMQDLSAVTGACLAFRKAIYVGMGGMDEALAVSFNDTDFCVRVRANGYRVLHTPYARLRHVEGATRGYDHTAAQLALRRREEATFTARWPQWVADDPAYNPNLARVGRSFALGEWVGIDRAVARRTRQAREAKTKT